jgi:RNase adaptor protein for sRNA GlmZ degradation
MSNALRLKVVACGTKFGEPPKNHVCYYLAHHEPWATLYGVEGRDPVINPFYVDALRPLDGRDPRIRDYIFADEEAIRRRQRIDNDLVALFEQVCSGQRRWIVSSASADCEECVFEEDNLFVIVTLCTGGKHRSQAFAVYIAEKAAELAQTRGIELQLELVFRDESKE